MASEKVAGGNGAKELAAARHQRDPHAARLMIINGPNLNYLGIREPHIYGHTTLKVLEAECRKFADHLGVELAFHQSNFEGAIVELIQSGRESADAIIINPAGLTFTSVALLDSLKMFEGPKIELHITNVHRREAIYHNSLVSMTATAVMAGLGPEGYGIAVDAMAMLLRAKTVRKKL